MKKIILAGALLSAACSSNAYCDHEAARAEACGASFDEMACRDDLRGCRARDQVDLVAYSNCLAAEGVGVCETCASEMLVECAGSPVPDPALSKVGDALAACRELLDDDLSDSCVEELYGCSASTTGAAPVGLVALVLAMALLRRRREIVLVGLVGCAGFDETNRCTPQFFVDADGDGFGDPATRRTRCDEGRVRGMVEIGGDCDDTDPQRYPGAEEICDGIDNDCDDVADEENRDQDRDGVSICEGDCDDLDPQIRPGAPERCNGLDDDCDGAPEQPRPEDEEDRDGDGFSFCDGDCDDDDPEVNPDVGFDGCDGVDSDCNGFIDDGVDSHEPNDDPDHAVVIAPPGGEHGGVFSHAGDVVDIIRIDATDEATVRVVPFDIVVRGRLTEGGGGEVTDEGDFRFELTLKGEPPFLLYLESPDAPTCNGSYVVSAEEASSGR